MPVFNEAAEEAQPAIRAAARAVREANEEGDVVCPACGAHNDAGAKFCDNCGKPLSRTCPACGALNDADAKFCDNCGKQL